MSKIKMMVDYLTAKVQLLKNRNCCFSADTYHSRVDSRAAIRQHVRFRGGSIGKYSYIGRNSLVQLADIGCFTSISENTNIGMPSHPMEYVSTSPVFLKEPNILNRHFARLDFEECPRTTIGHDVWIGTGAKIKSGLTIGVGAVIGAGAIVTHDVPPYAIVAGIPARIIRYRFDQDLIEQLLASRWWELDEQKLEKAARMMNQPDVFLKMIKE